MTGIRLDDVSKYYDGGSTVANYRLNLDVEDGEFLVLLGPSGCGKTTALRIVAGLEEPSEGDVYFGEDRVTGWSPSDRNVAMVFQNYALYPHMSVKENIEYPLKVRGIEPTERDRRIEEVADLLHIVDQLDSSPGEISGGQRQRVALARAIVREPTVFLLDEPLSNLDAKLRQEMRTELKRIQNELGVTTVYVTHNQEEAMSMADRVVVMNDGTIRQVAPPEELYQRPRSTWVAQFVGSPPMNLLRGRRRDGTIDLGDAGTVEMTVEDAAAGPVGQVGAAGTTAGDARASEAGVGTAGGDAATVEGGTEEPGGVAIDGDGSDGGLREEAGATATTDAGGEVTGGTAGDVATDAGEEVSLGVRPEDFSVGLEPPASGHAIRGTVDTVEPLGEYTIVNVTVSGQRVKAKEAHTDVERGDEVYLTFADEDAYLYDRDGQLLP